MYSMIPFATSTSDLSKEEITFNNKMICEVSKQIFYQARQKTLFWLPCVGQILNCEIEIEHFLTSLISYIPLPHSTPPNPPIHPPTLLFLFLFFMKKAHVLSCSNNYIVVENFVNYVRSKP